MKKHILPISVLALALTSNVQADAEPMSSSMMSNNMWSIGLQAGYSQTRLKAKSVTGWTMKSSPSAGAFNGMIHLGHDLGKMFHGRLLFGYDTATVKFATNGGTSARYKPRWQAGLGIHHTRSASENMNFCLGVDALFNFARTEQKGTTTLRKSSTLFSLVPTIGLGGELTEMTMWDIHVGYKFALNTSKLYNSSMAAWKFKTKPHGFSIRTGISYKF